MRRKAPIKSSNSLTRANIGFHLFHALLLPMLRRHSLEQMQPPVVIGAHGGSGTRVLPRVLRLADYWMGSWVNGRTEDAMATRFFLQRYFGRAIASRSGPDPDLERAFRSAIHSHRIRMPDHTGRWGWKNPRSMWMIPFLARMFPQMWFIHVVRDGRDVALSENLNLLHKHGALLLNEPHPERHPVRSQLRLWAIGNRIAADDGRRLLGERYLHLSYEALCADPRGTLAQVYAHLGVSATASLLEQAQSLVVPSRSIGAWRNSRYAILHRPDEEIATTLQRFGYSVTNG